MIHELTDPHHATAGWVGVPGERTFYLQFEDEDGLASILCEKGQVAGVAELLTELLARVDDQPATDWDRDAMQLRDPIEPLWRVGEIAVGLEPEDQRFLIELTELTAEDDDAEILRAWLNLDQTRRFVAHAAEAVGQGRPRCRFCGRPEEPEGHVCPATNGHGRLSR